GTRPQNGSVLAEEQPPLPGTRPPPARMNSSKFDAAHSRMGGVSESVRWLLLAYRIPSEPSRLRAGVWRALKALGAIYVQNAVAAVPEDPTAERDPESV